MKVIWMTSVYATETRPPMSVYKTAMTALMTMDGTVSTPKMTRRVLPAIYTPKCMNSLDESIWHLQISVL